MRRGEPERRAELEKHAAEKKPDAAAPPAAPVPAPLAPAPTLLERTSVRVGLGVALGLSLVGLGALVRGRRS
jgi:hypothetical protein